MSALTGATVRGKVVLSFLVGCGLAISLIFTAIGPVLSTIAVQFGGGTHGNVIAQLMMTLPSLGVILGGPTIGSLISNWGTRRVLFWCLVGYGLSGSAGLVTDATMTLLASRFLLGVAAVGVATSSTTLIGDFEETIRARALGYSSAVASAGAIASIYLAGILAEIGGWQLPFAIYGVAFALLLAGMVSLPGRQTRVGRPPRAADDSVSVLRFWPVYAAVVAVTVVVFMTGIQVSFLLAANGIAAPNEQAWIIACASIGATAGALTYGFARRAIGQARTFLLCLTSMGLGNLVLGSQHHALPLALGCALNGLGAGMTVPHFAGRLIENAPLSVRPRALGLMYTMIFVGEFVNPWIITPIHVRYGISAAFLAIGIATLVAGAYLALRPSPLASQSTELS